MDKIKGIGLNYQVDLMVNNSRNGAVGVDFEQIESFDLKISVPKRTYIGLPEVSEPDVIRHFTRLSTKNYSIDSGFYPLGSCTMKHNPRINEKLSRLEGFSKIHPLQDIYTIQGALEVMYIVQNYLVELSGLDGVSLAPAAGAQGELSGMMIIKAAHIKKEKRSRKIILIPDSAHGTNPATAVMCGYKVIEIPSDKNGLLNFNFLTQVVQEYKDDIAGIMLTNPNTCGKFELRIKEIAKLIHSVGAYFYCDGANFNAIVGNILPGDLGVDIMHFNLHKTFSTPHGGGGPGCGPIAVVKKLEQFLPSPHIKKNKDNFYELYSPESSIGKIKGFHGQFGMIVRALSYILSHGKDGLKQVSYDSVLSANYILHKLKDYYHVPFKGSCMHECLLTDKLQKKTGITTLDIAKALVEYGFHPMTIYFPLIVNGAMLIEPTETENKKTIDNFIKIMIHIAKECKSDYKEYPVSTPSKRLDEVKAAKEPILNWQELKKISIN